MRRLMWFAIGAAAACALFSYVLYDCSLVLCGVGFSALLLAVRFWEKRWSILRSVRMLLLGAIIALLWSGAYREIYLKPVLKLDGNISQISVTATDYSYETDYGCAVDGNTEFDGKQYKIRIYLNENGEISPGDRISGTFLLRYTAPGGRREATNHPGKGIFLLGYQRGEAILTCETGEDAFYPAEIAERVRRILKQSLPEDVFPFAKALLLGDGSDLSYQVDTDFKISGIRHIIAVSGLHVSILYTLISSISFKNRYLTALLSLPLLLLFAAVAGFTPSVSRACIMVGLMALAQAFGREYDSATALSFSALVMLAVNPMVITSASLQLSAGCVAGILLFQKPIGNWLISRLGETKGKGIAPRLKRWFVSSVSVTLSAMSLTAPLSAYYFGTVSLIGPVTNLLTLWVVNLAFNGLAVLCLLALVWSEGAAMLGSILAWLFRYVLCTAKVLASIPLSALYTVSVYIVIWIGFVYFLLTVFVVIKKKRPMQLVYCMIISLCVSLLASWAEPMTDDVRLTVLDAGQGQCILLQSDGKTFLVDCGGDNDAQVTDMAAETLLSQGINRLDGIIITHSDQDHAGGTAGLLSRVETDLLILPWNMEQQSVDALRSQTDAKVIFPHEDMEIQYGSSRIRIFGPIFAADNNENSLCVLFTREKCDILITGDRGSLGEQMLLRDASLPQVDVLIAGHHGSKYSTTEALLQTVRPELVIISAGDGNPYGHPSQELLDRLSRFGCAVRRTDLEGTILYRR